MANEDENLIPNLHISLSLSAKSTLYLHHSNILNIDHLNYTLPSMQYLL